MAEFTMPSLGADMDAGTLLQWLVEPGDTVHRGDVIALVDTDKAAVDVECFDDGVVGQLLVHPGEKVPVGTVLAVIAESGSAPAAAPSETVTEPTAPVAAPAPVAPPAPRRARRSRGGSPVVRHLASELGVDLAAVTGTGAQGAVTRRDVERAAARARAPVAAPPRPAAGSARAVPTSGRASPLARRLAAELGVELATLTGTGESGTVRAADVRRAAAASTNGPPPSTRHRVAEPAAAPVQSADHELTMRAAIAALMARSNREIPHYHLTWTVDLTAATQWLRDRNRHAAVADRLVPAVLMLKAAARAAREVPELNGSWVQDRFVPASEVHLGMIVSLRAGGIVAPVIRDAADLELPELMRQVRDLVERARRGRLRASELSGGTITVSNLGEQGAESVLGVIYPPQVALVGFGAVAPRPWAVDGLLGVRPLVTTSLSADHRASDGATGSRYLQALARALQRPEQL